MESLASEEIFKGTSSSKIEEAASSDIEETESLSSSDFVTIDDWYTCADGKEVEDVVTLFTSCKTEILVSGDGRKVPISYLEGKVVGLYFYSCRSSDFVFRELGYMYEKLRNDHGENFEIVFICHHPVVPTIEKFSGKLLAKWEEMFEKKFMKHFEGKSWLLASPFSQRKRNHMFYSWSLMLRDYYQPTELVIIQPSENIAHAYAMDIYREFGIDAYPFSKSNLTDFEVARLKTLTLESVLSAEQLIIIDQNRLKGKKILLFLDPHCPEKLKLFYKKMGAWYKDLKAEDEEFEMIRVYYMPRKEEEEEAAYGYEKNSWVELPYLKDMIDKMQDIFKYTGMKMKMDGKIPMTVAFGQDGKFITMDSHEDLIDLIRVRNYSQTPHFFEDTHLYETVSDSIAIEKKWCSLDEKRSLSDFDLMRFGLLGRS